MSVRTMSVVSVIVSFLYSAGTVQASAATMDLEENSFHDARFGLEFTFPADWEIRSRTDTPGVEDYLVLTGPGECTFGRCAIAIGKRPLNISDGQSLEEWARVFVASIVTEPGDFYLESVEGKSLVSGFTEAIRVAGPAYQSVNLERSQEVWFVSANFPEWSAENTTFNRVLRSLRLSQTGSSESTSKQDDQLVYLTDDYGLFQIENKISSSWYSPVRNQSNGNPWDVHCGSPAHFGGSEFAADIDADYGVPVRAAREGVVTTVDKVGSATGFGKYVVIETDGYYHYYAHLSSVRSYINVGYNVSRRGLLLGYVGDTGAGTTHLHFHIQFGASHTTSSPKVLNGMTGFVDIDYPGGGYYCATMGR